MRKTLKGIVHPKMKILSSFTHPQVVPNLYECLCSADHKGRYSEECGKLSSSGAPLTSIVFFFLLWKSMVPQNSLVTNFLQNIFSTESGTERINSSSEHYQCLNDEPWELTTFATLKRQQIKMYVSKPKHCGKKKHAICNMNCIEPEM